MSLIRIKRSGSSGSPGALAQGEMAYSFLGGTQANGGDRLYIGTGTETSGVAANIEVIGGKYFTAMLDHVPGTLTATSALVVDSNSKIDILNVDNITINGNAITSTDTNGNITLDPNGTGSVDVSSAKIINLATPTANTDAATKKYVDDQFAGGSAVLQIAADSGTTDTVLSNQIVTFAGGVGLSSAVTNNNITINLDNTAVTAGSYGSSSAIPTFTVDAQGRLTAAGTASLATNLSIAGDSGTDTVPLLTDTLTVSGGTGLTSAVTNNNITINLDNTAVTAGSYGSSSAIPTFTVDAQGRLTAAGTASLATNLSIAGDSGTDTVPLLTDTLTVTGGTGLTSAVTNNNITINLDNTAVTAGTYGTATAIPTIVIDAQGRITSAAANTIAIPSTQVTDFAEAVQDTVGGMLTGTQNGITVTYTDNGAGAGSLSFDVADPTITLSGDVTGSATMTNLGNVTITTTIAADSVALGTDTTGNYVASIANGSYITGGNGGSEGATLTLAVDAATAATASKVVARDSSGNFAANTITAALAGNATTATTLQTARTIGGVSFDGSANINLPGVNATGNQNTTGSAATLTTARTIALSGDVAGSVTFDGSANVTISTTIQSNSVALGTDTTGNYVASLVQGTGVTISNNTGEGTTPTVAIGQDVATTANVTFRDINSTGNVVIDGNLTVSGNSITIHAQSIAIQDNLIFLNDDVTETITGAVGNGTTVVYTVSGTNTFDVGINVTITGVNPSAYNLSNQTITASNSSTFSITNAATGTYVSGGIATARNVTNPDLGFVGHYNDGGDKHAGFFRDATDGRFKVFQGLTPEPSTSVDTANATFQYADLQANTVYANLSGTATSVSTDLTFNSSGSGAASGTTFNGGTARTVSYNTIGASPLAGSTSLTTLGTIATGTWNGSLIAGQYGGTGVNNTGRTITLSGNISTANNFTTSGNFALTLTSTAATNVTLPTTGTLATLAGSETFTNKTLILPTIGGTGAVFNGSTSGSTTLVASAAAGATTVTLPATTGTVITTGDTGTVTSTMILDGTIVNADINASAGIVDTKLATISTSGKVLNSATTATTLNTASAIVARDASGNFTAGTITAALSGNATTATTLQTARTITLAGDVAGSASFDGSANVSITATIQANSVALGTDTTGNYAGSVAVSGSGLTLTGTAGEGTAYTIDSNATALATANTIVFRDASGNFAANTITAALAGNASTATTLQTARTIALAGDVAGSVSFNGSANVSITATIQPNSVALGTDTTGNYAADVSVTSDTGLAITGAAGEGTSFVLAGINANNTVKGVASFSANNFTVSSGAVSIATLDGGTY
jgi:hypothetical protein